MQDKKDDPPPPYEEPKTCVVVNIPGSSVKDIVMEPVEQKVERHVLEIVEGVSMEQLHLERKIQYEKQQEELQEQYQQQIEHRVLKQPKRIHIKEKKERNHVRAVEVRREERKFNPVECRQVAFGLVFFIFWWFVLYMVFKPNYTFDNDPVCGYGSPTREYGLTRNNTNTTDSGCICHHHYTVLRNTTMCNYRQYSKSLTIYLHVTLGWLGVSWMYVDQVPMAILSVALLVGFVSLSTSEHILTTIVPRIVQAGFWIGMWIYWIVGLILICQNLIEDGSYYRID